MRSRTGWALAGVLALALLWAPLPFGGAISAAEAGLRALAFLALVLAAVSAASAAELGAAGRMAAAAAAVAALGWLQSLPMPVAAAERFSPEHARLFFQASQLSAAGEEDEDAGVSAGAALAERPRTTLSVAPWISRDAALGWAAAAAALIAGGVAGRSRRKRRLLGLAVLAAAAFEVFFGVRGWLARATAIWGRPVPGSPVRLRGTFVNSDHLALYLGMALALAFAWGWWALRRALHEPRPEWRVMLVAPPALAWLTFFAGLAATGSRAGLAAAIAATAVQGVLLGRQARVRRGRELHAEREDRDRRRKLRALAGLAGIALVVCGLGVAAALGLGAGPGRLLATSTMEVSWAARREAYAGTLALWRKFPLTGAGLGTFRDAFPLVQPARLPGAWRHAHSDPLELLATAGPLGLALAAAGVALLLRRLALVLRQGSRSEDRAAGLAGLGILAATGVHEAIDFGLAMPANALTLCVLLGAAAAARTVAEGSAGSAGNAGSGRGGASPAGRSAASRGEAPGEPPPGEPSPSEPSDGELPLGELPPGEPPPGEPPSGEPPPGEPPDGEPPDVSGQEQPERLPAGRSPDPSPNPGPLP